MDAIKVIHQGVRKADLVSRKKQNKHVYEKKPPSVYEPTDVVLVRTKRQGKKGTHIERCREAVVQRRLPSHNYIVLYGDGTKENVPVGDITDVTRKKEKDRHKSSGNYFFFVLSVKSFSFVQRVKLYHTTAAMDNVNDNICHHLS